MEKRFDVVVDLKGNAVEGATVRVTTYPAGVLATIYSDNDGVTAIANPVTTDDTGYFEYYAADGHYTWLITTNETAKTINDIVHGSGGGSGGEFVVATGTGDALVVAAFSEGYSLSDGDEIRVRAPGENTVTAPTINLPVVGVLTIYKLGGQALQAQEGGIEGTGDIHRAGHEITLRYRASPERMELIGAL
ncbi:MAG: hypothetical protein U1A72_09740 [Sulfuritalea sp.]|nr:hypothetical protein [Sulfuritalea sp.]